MFSGPVNIKWFGAVADFNGTSGTDNTASIQDAIDSFPFVYIPFGRFKIDTPLKLKSNSSLKGDGVASELCTKSNINLLTNDITTPSTDYLINVQIKDLKVSNYFNVPNDGGCTSHQIRLKNAQLCKIMG